VFLKLYLTRTTASDVETHFLSLSSSDNEEKFVTLKIADFGLAIADSDYQVHQQSASAIGSIYYQAPEVLVARQSSPAADVYALGLVVWQLFTASPEFVKDSAFSHATSVVRMNWRPPLPPGIILEPVRNLLTRCWRANAAERPTCAEFRAELTNLLLVLQKLPPQHDMQLGTCDYCSSGGENESSCSEEGGDGAASSINSSSTSGDEGRSSTVCSSLGSPVPQLTPTLSD
jgi:serine/threonine protein kinase